MDFLNDWSTWKTLVWAAVWGPPLALIHELGHAVVALGLTRGPVMVCFGAERRWAARLGRLVLAVSAPTPAFCVYDSTDLRGSAKSQAWIAAAGPFASLATTVGLALLAGGAHGTVQGVLAVGALCSGLTTLGSGLPMRYGRGLAEGITGDSDGMAVWRILTGGPRRPGSEEKDVAVARPVFLVLLALAGVLAFLADPLLGVGLVALFGFAWLRQAGDGA